jgi:hypothetical protein
MLDLSPMNVSLIPIDKANLESYIDLFQHCFPASNMTKNYIEWLYFQNPMGNVIGFDSVVEDQIVSHYACIPISVCGQRGLLSLNTATRDKFRSKGLFKTAALRTIKVAQQDYSFIVGVANNSSTNIFVNKLGFEKLGSLELRFGRVDHSSQSSVDWNEDSILWRLSKPGRKYVVKKLDKATMLISTKLSGTPFIINTMVSTEGESESAKDSWAWRLTLDWQINKNPIIKLPKFAKPSPLNLVIRHLKSPNIKLKSWSFLDFDIF